MLYLLILLVLYCRLYHHITCNFVTDAFLYEASVFYLCIFIHALDLCIVIVV